MRVAMLSVHTCPLAALGGKDTGGMNVYVRELSRELGKRGVAVDIYTRSQDASVPHLQEAWPCIRVIHVPAGPETPYDRRQLFQYLPEFVQGVRSFVAADGVTYDIIHSHYWLSGWVALELQRDWPVPVMQMFHTLGHLKNNVAANGKSSEAPERIRTETEIMGRADLIVAATPADKGQMVEFYGADPSPIVVVPPGVDLSLFRPIPQDEARRYVGLTDCDDRLLLFVGRLDPVKGLNVLFEALCHLIRNLMPERQRRICLAVIGGESVESAEALRENAVCLDEVKERYGLEEMIAFLGSRSQDTLPYYYSAADICVMPSLYESFGMVALEAMACGTPVVASRVGGLPYVVRDGETGLLVPDNDPLALAEKLRLILTDADLRLRLGGRAQEVAQGYGWERVADASVDLYQRAIAGYPGSLRERCSGPLAEGSRQG